MSRLSFSEFREIHGDGERVVELPKTPLEVYSDEIVAFRNGGENPGTFADFSEALPAGTTETVAETALDRYTRYIASLDLPTAA